MKNKILSFGLIALLSAVTYPLIATAGLWSYYNQERNQPMPSREVRASYATDIGIENYSGTASQNIALEKYVREVDSWEDRVRAGNLTDEELKQVPERVWKRLVPQVIQVVSPPDSFGEDELGFGMPQAGNIITCRDTDCDKYLTNNEQNLGYSVVSRYRTNLQSSMTSVQTTVPVSSIATFDGHTLTMADLGSQVYLTVEPGASREEIVKCTTITSSQWSSCTRGLAFYGTSESAVSANQKAHNAGSIVVMSNVHYVYENLLDNDSTQTVSGTLKYSVYPEVLVAVGNATTSRQLLTLGQAQALTNQGAASSTESVAGICELSTKLENASSTPFGVDDPHCIQSQHATTTPDGVTNGNYVVVTKNNKKIDQGFIDQTENFSWSGAHDFGSTLSVTATSTFTTTTMTSSTITHLNVQTVSTTKNITINGLDGNTLATASTTNASDYHYHKDGVASGQFTRAINTTGNQLISHSLGVTPSYIQITCFAEVNGGTASYGSSYGTYTIASTRALSFQGATYFTQQGSNIAIVQRGQNASNIIALIDEGGVADAIGNLSASTVDTFTVNWTTNVNAGGTRYCQYSAWK